MTTVLCLANRGLIVIGADAYSSKVDAINDKNLAIHEAGLDGISAESIGKGFKVTTEIPSSDILFMTPGTPSKKDGSVDETYV